MNKEGSQKNKEKWKDNKRRLSMRSQNNQYAVYSYS